MKKISFNDIKSSEIPPLECYRWVNDALRIKDSVLLPKKISLKPDIDGVFYNTMPCIIPSENIAGVKIVTRYPDRIPSLQSHILLYKLSDGECLALLDGDWITAMRTGAVAVNSIDILAKKDFNSIGIIGLGNTARATIEILLNLYPEKELVLNLKTYKNQHLDFINRFSSDKYNLKRLHFNTFDNYEDVISHSDVIISAATVFKDDICDNSMFRKGSLVIPIHTRGFTNCDLFFDKVFADDVNHVKDFKYFNYFKSFGEIADVLAGKIPGRENDDERIIVYNIGISLHDIYFAKKIYDQIAINCSELDLMTPKDKFWV